MTDRTCLDVAADVVRALGNWHREGDQWITGRMVSAVEGCRAALDAIHPALADLTPDEVTALFAACVTSYRWGSGVMKNDVPFHAWEVLNRD